MTRCVLLSNRTRAQKVSYDRLAEILLKIERSQDDGEKA